MTHTLGILAVLVVHERPLQGVAAWPRLQIWLSAARTDPGPSVFQVEHLLIYDNSPTQRVDAPVSPQITVVHDATNGGTRAAYLHAASLAQALNLRWLLLLDHDTALPGDFLDRASHAASLPGASACAAWLPDVMSHGQLISPAWMRPSGIVSPMSRASEPVHAGRCVTGIASGSLVEVEAMRACTPPPPAMWLDGVDHWYFLQLQRLGRPIGRFDAVLEHDLSVMDYSTLSARRARSILAANRALLDALPWQATALYPWRVIWFVGKLWRRNPAAASALCRGLWVGKPGHG